MAPPSENSATEAGAAVRKAYQAIRDGIVQGLYPPGSRLREEHMAEVIGVSRTPIREALRLLTTDGLLDLVPGQGAFVTSWSPRDLENIFAVRALIESSVAELAARNLQTSDIIGLADLAGQMEALAESRRRGFLDQITDLNYKFHRTVALACGNDRLNTLLTHTVEMIVVHRTFRRYQPEQLRRSMAHHRELIDAFTARDSEWAGSVMRSHVLAAKNALLNSMMRSSDRADAADGSAGGDGHDRGTALSSAAKVQPAT